MTITETRHDGAGAYDVLAAFEAMFPQDLRDEADAVADIATKLQPALVELACRAGKVLDRQELINANVRGAFTALETEGTQAAIDISDGLGAILLGVSPSSRMHDAILECIAILDGIDKVVA